MNKNEPVENIEYSDRMDVSDFPDHTDFLDSLSSPLERKIANWCINNIPTLSRLDRLNQLNVVFYSDLLMNPEAEFKKILDSLNICLSRENDKILKSVNFRRASKTDFRGELKLDPNEQLNKNFKELDEQTKNKVQRIFDEFGFKLYNAFSPLPNKEYLKKSSSV